METADNGPILVFLVLILFYAEKVFLVNESNTVATVLIPVRMGNKKVSFPESSYITTKY